MNMLYAVIVLLLQLVTGWLLSFVVPFALGIGDGRELIAFAFGSTTAVWGVGALAALLQGTFDGRQYLWRLVATAVGSILGVTLILITPPTGFVQVFFPLAGALLGYYIVGLIAPVNK